jgi:2-(1,2-epoxy-1,2-dihydrophenyl)acetyl-CoA isomerase
MSAPDRERAILERRDGGVVVLTMNAPQKRNALIPEIRDGLLEALARLEEDRECRAIIITGAEGYFCAGGDISNPGPFTALQVRAMMKRPQRLLKAIAGHSKPIIAAVEGPAFGAGLALASACDFIVAGESATFCAAYGRIGVMPDIGLLWSLPLRVGMGVVREVIMFADVIKAPEAKAMGIVDWLAEGTGAEAFAMEKAQKLAVKATASISVSKALLARAPLDMETVLAHEIEGQAWLGSTEDAQEGVLAFREKRKPVFKGY